MDQTEQIRERAVENLRLIDDERLAGMLIAARLARRQPGDPLERERTIIQGAAAAQELILRYLEKFPQIAREYPELEQEEVVSAGYSGLTQAIREYAETDYPFAQYARRRVHESILALRVRS